MADAARILLTGATGFLGARLLRGLRADGHSVVALRRANSDMARVADLLEETPFWNIEEASPEALFAAHEIDTIVHAAACYGRRGESEAEIEAANMNLPLAILRAGLSHGVRWVFNVGTSLPQDVSIYARTKEAFRTAATDLVDRAGAAFIHLRLEHMYGPSDDESRFIPYLARRFLERAPSIDLTAGEQERDFIHVDDAAAAIRLLVSQRRRFDGATTTFEIGAGEAYRLRRVVEDVRRLCGAATELRFGARPYRKGETMRSVADLTAMAALGWQPRILLDEGLRDTIAFERLRLGS